jgi:outer membrane murein-binding lipoprotein Lpp
MKSLSILVSALVLAGCASNSHNAGLNSDESYISNEVNTLLATLAQKAVDAKEITLKHQAAMARLSEPENGYDDPTGAPPEGLERVIPMPDFYGEAVEPLKLIAKLTNYDFKFRGLKPNSITWVSIAAQERPAFDAISDIANQIDKFGINIDIWSTPNAEKQGVILVTYPGAND